MSKSIPELSLDGNVLYHELIQHEISDEIDYVELSRIIGRDIRKKRGALYTAINMARREKNMVFATIRNKGIKRLNDSEIINGIGTKTTNTIKNAARRGRQKTKCIADFGNLPREDKNKAFAYESIFSMIEQCMKQSSIKKITNKCSETQQHLPLAKTLESFKES